jgi:hypothetical protein
MRFWIRFRLWNWSILAKLAIGALLGFLMFNGHLFALCGSLNIWFLMNILSLPLALYTICLLHEGCHALVGHLVGFRIDTITVGAGRRLLKARIGETTLELRLGSFRSAVRMAPRSPATCSVPRIVSMQVAGCVGTCLLAGAVYLSVPYGMLSLFGNYGCSWSIAGTLFAFSAVLTIGNLMPLRVGVRGGNYTDGYRIIEILRRPEVGKAIKLAAPYVNKAAEAYRNHNYASAQSICSEGLLVAPRSFHLKLFLGVTDIHLGAPSTARPKLETALNEFASNGLERALAWNGIAYCDALIGDPRYLEEADEFSLRAITVLPMSDTIGTRGSVHVWSAYELAMTNQGQSKKARWLLTQGIQLLHKAHNSAQTDTSRLAEAAWLSVAYALQGMHELSSEYLEQAKSAGGMIEEVYAVSRIADIAATGLRVM